MKMYKLESRKIMKNKKLTLTIIGVVALVLITIGLSYAYWLITKTQNQSNLITSACLDIDLINEKNDINLSQQYPISDADGMALTPYEFTVTNKCNVALDYQIALEATGDSEKALLPSSLKVALDNNYELLSSKNTTTTTTVGAYASYILGHGTLKAKGSTGSEVTHKVRIWIDENAPIDEANKTFASKVTVTVGQGILNLPFSEGMLGYAIYNNAKENNYLYNTTPDFSKVTVEGEHGLYKAEDDLGPSYYFRGDTENNYVQFGSYETIKETGGEHYWKVAGTKRVIEYETWGEYASEEECDEERSNLGNDYASCNYNSDNDVWVLKYGNETIDEILGTERYGYEYDCENSPEYEDFMNEDADPYCTEIFEETTTETVIKDMYWRIIRVNGDGTVRLIYAGSEKKHNGENISEFITEEVPNSRSELEEFYNNRFQDNQYIANEIFCEDREIYLTDDLEEEDDEAVDYYINYYATHNRLTNNLPKLTCTRSEDKYTASNDNRLGNGLLNFPIGSITADEVIMAGGKVDQENNTYYLYAGDNYITSSPLKISVEPGYAGEEYSWVYIVKNDGSVSSIYDGNDSEYYNVRPVINLQANVPFTGNGSFDTPYVITTN